MLVEFAIEVDAIDGSTNPSVIDRLLKTWRHYGVLISPGRRDSSIKQRLESLKNPTLRKIWKDAWMHVLKQTRNAYRSVPVDGTRMEGWNAIASRADLASYSFIDMALLKQQRADDLGISQGSPELCGNVEGARIHDVDQTSRVRDSALLSQEDIERDIQIVDLWTKRFERFAKTSREVSIVDKYAFQKGTIDGLYQFLNLLNRDSESSRVIIYTSPGKAAHPSTEIARIETSIRKETETFTGSGIGTIEIRFLRDGLFRIDGHDRHVRFDNNIFNIGVGIMIFAPPKTRYTTTAHMRALDPLNLSTFPPIPKEYLLDQKREGDAKNLATQTITITYPLS